MTVRNTTRPASLLIILTVAAVGSAVVTGCADTESEFVIAEPVSDLYPPAQKFIQNELDQRFGDPQNVVMWDELPVDWGGIEGRVGTVPESEQEYYDFETQLPVVWNDKDVEIDVKPGDKLLFKTGAYGTGNADGTGMTIHVERFDEEDQAFVLRAGSRFDVPPEPGSRFVYHPGQVIREGRQLYHEHCLHCHGVSGDGAGPTAKYLNPLPRDYRKGIFKFKSTDGSKRIRREDLARILRHGIPGTYMPSFMLLEDDELHAIIEYVRWLSFRGQYEDIMITAIESEGYNKEAVAQRIEKGESAREVRDAWNEYSAEDLLDAIDEEIAYRVEDWNAVDPPEAELKPITARNSMAEPLVEYLSALSEARSGKVVEVEKAESGEGYDLIEIEMEDGSRLAAGDSLQWTSGSGAGSSWSVPGKVRRGSKLYPEEEGEQPATDVKAGDTFAILSVEAPAKALAYLNENGTSLEDLTKLVNEAEDLEAELLTLSEERGKVLYESKAVGCVSCHGPKGLGNGPQTEAQLENVDTKEPYPGLGLHDAWNNPIMPRNLTQGIYRGGRRPVDLYRRLYVGIKGTPMQSFAGSLVTDGHDYKLWDVVNYVYSIPFRSREPGYFLEDEKPASDSTAESGTPEESSPADEGEAPEPTGDAAARLDRESAIISTRG